VVDVWSVSRGWPDGWANGKRLLVEMCRRRCERIVIDDVRSVGEGGVRSPEFPFVAGGFASGSAATKASEPKGKRS